MTHHPTARSVALAVVCALALGLGGMAAYVLSRPPATLEIQPVEAVPPAAPASVAHATGAPRSTASARGGGIAGGDVAVSPVWVRRTAAESGIPAPAVQAYGEATLRSAAQDPACHLAWTTLAGIGWVESQQGTVGGRVLEADGRPDRPITGVSLDGSGRVAAVPDGSGGYQRALGPLQFIPSTWEQWASDGDGDGVADPQDVNDAAYAAARYLCSAGGDLATGPGWSAAVFSYNHSDAYVRSVYTAAQTYASRTS